MSGFDNGTLQQGIFFQVKQFGSILRGFGPPAPQAGVVGDLYIDVLTWNLFNKRSAAAGDDVDPWGHYLFTVPPTYQTGLKWFATTAPSNDIGVAGDYCLLWGGWANYGMQPSIYGPKQATSWPENGEGPNLTIAPDGGSQTILASVGSPILVAPGSALLTSLNGSVGTLGLLDEGPALGKSTSTQLIATGLTSEIIFPTPVNSSPGNPVTQLGLQSGPAQVTVTINPLYTAEDQHSV